MEEELTRRQRIAALLGDGEWTLRELARELGEKLADVADDLAHLQRSLGRKGLRVTPGACEACGFVFSKRDRLSAPSRCPRCRSERIAEPRVSLRA